MNKAAQLSARSNASALLEVLVDRGIHHVFANAGTDFAPLIEAMSAAAMTGARLPRFHTIPHENLAVSMAHGYYLASGEPAAVMVHVTVGTANALCGIMNAARDHIPLLLLAGKTPNTETGHAGSRSVSIHWGQDSFDQGGILREYVKWDYELRAGQSIENVIQRALDIAMSEPRGPVYLIMPREVLADPTGPRTSRRHARPLGVIPPEPCAVAIEKAAEAIMAAEFPILLTASLGRDGANLARLATMAEKFAIGIGYPGEPGARDVNVPNDHRLFLGTNPENAIERADVIVVVDCEVPWWPRYAEPAPGAVLIHIGPDPLHARIPLHGFDMDLAIAGSSTAALQLLSAALDSRSGGTEGIIARRRGQIARMAEALALQRRRLVEGVSNRRPVHPAWVASCINKVLDRKSIVVNEMGVPMDLLDLREPRSYMSTSLSAGLGSGLGTSLGAKLAAPDSNVILLVGDGSYMFGNPVAAHFVACAENLPTLTVVMNNGQWNAVQRSTVGMYPDGLAARNPDMPLIALRPAPDYERIIEGCGGFGARVDDPAALLPALVRGLEAVADGSPALLNILTGSD